MHLQWNSFHSKKVLNHNTHLFLLVVLWQSLLLIQGGYLQKMYKKGKAPKQNDDATELENAKAVAEATANMKPFEIVCPFSIHLYTY